MLGDLEVGSMILTFVAIFAIGFIITTFLMLKIYGLGALESVIFALTIALWIIPKYTEANVSSAHKLSKNSKLALYPLVFLGRLFRGITTDFIYLPFVLLSLVRTIAIRDAGKKRHAAKTFKERNREVQDALVEALAA